MTDSESNDSPPPDPSPSPVPRLASVSEDREEGAEIGEDDSKEVHSPTALKRASHPTISAMAGKIGLSPAADFKN